MKVYDFIKCPISKMIFNKPVIAEDGETYEEFFIKNWLNTNSSAPIKGIKIGKDLRANNVMERIVKSFLEENPELKEEQYRYEVDVKSVLESGKYEELLDCNDFSFSDIFFDLWVNFLTSGKTKIIKHVIENWNDYNEEITNENNSFKLIHLICCLCDLTIIQIFIENPNINVNLEEKNKNNETPLSCACADNNLEVIKYLISKGANLEAEDIEGYRPIHYIFRCQPNSIIEWFMELNVNKRVRNKKGESIFDVFKYNKHNAEPRIYKESVFKENKHKAERRIKDSCPWETELEPWERSDED